MLFIKCIIMNHSFNKKHLLSNPNLTINNQNSKKIKLFKKYGMNNNYLEINDDISNYNCLGLKKHSLNKNGNIKNQIFKSALDIVRKSNTLNYSYDSSLDYNIIPNKLKSKNKNTEDLSIYNKISNKINSNTL